MLYLHQHNIIIGLQRYLKYIGGTNYVWPSGSLSKATTGNFKKIKIKILVSYPEEDMDDINLELHTRKKNAPLCSRTQTCNIALIQKTQ